MTYTKFLLPALAALALFTAPAVIADHHGGKGGKLFEKHDTDGDGKISSAEHIAAAQERFKKMDLDGDGFITKDEAKEAREKMKEKIKERRESKSE